MLALPTLLRPLLARYGIAAPREDAYWLSLSPPENLSVSIVATVLLNTDSLISLIGFANFAVFFEA